MKKEWRWFWSHAVFYSGTIAMSIIILITFIMMYMNPSGFAMVYEHIILIRNVEMLLASFILLFSIYKIRKLVRCLDEIV